MLDCGFWILDFGFWALFFRAWIWGLGFWILGLDFGFWALGLDFGLPTAPPTRAGTFRRLLYERPIRAFQKSQMEPHSSPLSSIELPEKPNGPPQLPPPMTGQLAPEKSRTDPNSSPPHQSSSVSMKGQPERPTSAKRTPTAPPTIAPKELNEPHSSPHKPVHFAALLYEARDQRQMDFHSSPQLPPRCPPQLPFRRPSLKGQSQLHSRVRKQTLLAGGVRGFLTYNTQAKTSNQLALP